VTNEETEWIDSIVELGCICCWLQGHPKTPAAVHHILTNGKRTSHLHTLPLCDPGHHQNSPTPEKISRHPNKARFEEKYGTEAELLEATRQLVAKMREVVA
jgi:hypothetical protein